MNDRPETAQRHNFSLKCRQELSLDGILDVIGFDDKSVSLKTALGAMIIDGENLHITQMSLETGEVVIHGNVCGIFYENLREKNKGGFFRRLTR